jgi:hypothetical protein
MAGGGDDTTPQPGRRWSAEQGVPLDDGEPIVTIKDLFRFAGLLPSEPS